MITKVEVVVLAEQGRIVEHGEVIRSEGDWWEYLPKLAGKTITATWKRMRQKLVCKPVGSTLIDGFIRTALKYCSKSRYKRSSHAIRTLS